MNKKETKFLLFLTCVQSHKKEFLSFTHTHNAANHMERVCGVYEIE
jgi:hypothetical protein